MILVEAIGDVPFSVGPIAVLAVAVLGLLAIAAAPDVLLRAVGTSRRVTTDVSIRRAGARSEVDQARARRDVVIGGRREAGDFLVLERTAPMWIDRDDLQIAPYGRECHDA
ncbi:MAG TPA: hypothetical protein VGJ59_02850 [Jatrophihabitantaceae bacterium]|jgi:hypothetical protein